MYSYYEHAFHKSDAQRMWRSGNGQLFHLKDMKDDHIDNCINMLYQRIETINARMCANPNNNVLIFDSPIEYVHKSVKAMVEIMTYRKWAILFTQELKKREKEKSEKQAKFGKCIYDFDPFAY